MKTGILAVAAALMVVTSFATSAFAADDWGPDTADPAFSNTNVWPGAEEWGPDTTDPDFADVNVWPAEEREADSASPAGDSTDDIALAETSTN